MRKWIRNNQFLLNIDHHFITISSSRIRYCNDRLTTTDALNHTIFIYTCDFWMITLEKNGLILLITDQIDLNLIGIANIKVMFMYTDIKTFYQHICLNFRCIKHSVIYF